MLIVVESYKDGSSTIIVLLIFHSILLSTCAVYGWVQEISDDRMFAGHHEDIPATPEGEIITLYLYFTKNGPISPSGILFTIQTSGTATGVYNIIILYIQSRDTIYVTLLRSGYCMNKVAIIDKIMLSSG